MTLDLALDRPAGGRRAPLGRMLLVTGGKGGVGKTTLAVNLAVQLALDRARAGAAVSGAAAAGAGGAAWDPTTPHLHPPDRAAGGRVAEQGGKSAPPLLVDLDLGLADVGVLLRLGEAPGVEGLFGGEGLEACLAEGPEGLVVLPAASGAHELARPDAGRRERLFGALAEAGGRWGAIVADSPAGIGPDVLAAVERAGRVLVVTTPEPAAMTDAYGLVKALDAYAREGGVEVPTPELFVNLAASAEEAREVGERLAAVTRRFLARSPRLVGWMPRSRAVAESVVAQEPFVLSRPRSLPALCVARLARRVAAQLQGAAPAAPQGFAGHDR